MSGARGLSFEIASTVSLSRLAGLLRLLRQSVNGAEAAALPRRATDMTADEGRNARLTVTRAGLYAVRQLVAQGAIGVAGPVGL